MSIFKKSKQKRQTSHTSITADFRSKKHQDGDDLMGSNPTPRILVVFLVLVLRHWCEPKWDWNGYGWMKVLQQDGQLVKGLNPMGYGCFSHLIGTIMFHSFFFYFPYSLQVPRSPQVSYNI